MRSGKLRRQITIEGFFVHTKEFAADPGGNRNELKSDEQGINIFKFVLRKISDRGYSINLWKT